MQKMIPFCTVLCLLLFPGCGGGPSEEPWTMVLGITTIDGQADSLDLEQDGTTISGTTTGGGTVNGTAIDNTADIRISYAGNYTLTMVLTNNSGALVGTFSDSNGKTIGVSGSMADESSADLYSANDAALVGTWQYDGRDAWVRYNSDGTFQRGVGQANNYGGTWTTSGSTITERSTSSIPSEYLQTTQYAVAGAKLTFFVPVQGLLTLTRLSQP